MMKLGQKILATLVLVSMAIAAGPAIAASVTYEYDDFGRLKKVLHADGVQVIYSYDKVGNRTARTVSGLGSVNLGVSLTDAPDPAYVAGTDITYLLTVANAGPDSAANVAVVLSLTGGASVVSATPSQGNCNAGLVCSIGQIANGGSATVTLLVDPASAGDLTLDASAASDDTDTDSADNTASETTTVKPRGSNCFQTPLSGGFFLICGPS